MTSHDTRAVAATVAILTCHNRKELTIRCLDAFFAQTFGADEPPSLRAVVVDDGSSDGTGEAVRDRFGAATVVRGDGTLYWARGMQTAEAVAIKENPAFLLWLNDDVDLFPDAVHRLHAVARECPRAIVVGALTDPETGALTYSGRRRSRWHPMRTRLVAPSDHPVEVDTFNGNVVLVPHDIYRELGAIDGGFAHSQADFDYGLRARAAGLQVVVAPGTVGHCRRTGSEGTFTDRSLPLRKRWELIRRPTGLPPGSHVRFLRRHGGYAWPVFWFAPYAKLAVGGFAEAVLRQVRRLRAVVTSHRPRAPR